MQPVLEIRKVHEHSYTYSVRGPKSSAGGLPPDCYVDGGQTSFAACLYDASQALKVYFPRVYIRYQGHCMGEIEVNRLRECAEFIAQQLKAEYLRRGVPVSPVAAMASTVAG